MADPFAETAPAPASPGPGFLGIPSSSWQNLANFGANMSVAANARDPNGFLTYGSGIAGPMGEAMIQTDTEATCNTIDPIALGLQVAEDLKSKGALDLLSAAV